MAKKIIYQVLTRLWGNGRMSGFDDKSLSYLKELGVDIIWYTGIPRHSSGKDFVKGNPGCPYSVTDWFDVNPYLAEIPEKRIDEFKELVYRTHTAGMKVCTDFIPNHVARDYEGNIPHFNYWDGDWSDTLKVNWNAADTISRMVEVLCFWAGMGVDAFRCDMVEMVPVESLGEVIRRVREQYPDLIFIAEVYGKDNYRRYIDTAGFDLLYDKSGNYDILRDICNGTRSARELSWNWQFLSDMQPKMLNFLENHDEPRCVSKSMPFNRASVAFSILWNDASFMLYFGQEVGEDASQNSNGRTSIFNWEKPAMVSDLMKHIEAGGGAADSVCLNGKETDILNMYSSLLLLAKENVFTEGRYWDLNYCQDDWRYDQDNYFVFVRFNHKCAKLVFCNFGRMTAKTGIKIPSDLSEAFKANGLNYCGEDIQLEVKAGDYSIIDLV